MNESVNLGRIAGIRIGVNWSWLVVVVLIVWTLAAGIFPETNPGLSRTAHYVMAVVAAALFFASLLAHEMGHAVVARREGMEIEGITLWLFGGVARFRGQFPSAGAEFRIAIAGPLVSLALGGLFVLVAVLLEEPEAVDAVAAWLGYINLSLLVFNMLPALPLDGGRVLRSILWASRGDFAWATRTSGSIARALAIGLIGLGILLVLVQGAFSGLWLAFLGWFLLAAAEAEVRSLATRQALAGLRVADVMVRDPVVTRPDLTLADFLDEVVWPNRYTTYPVVERGRAVGLLPFRRVAEVPRGEWERRRVRECMVPLADVPLLREDDELVDALFVLAGSEIGRGLVLVDGRLAGLVSMTDLARALEAPRPRRLADPARGPRPG